jgi:hypothetical protein
MDQRAGQQADYHGSTQISLAMQKITSSEELRAAILELELAHREEGASLKDEFHVVYQELQPINIIKNTVRQAVHSRDLKDDLINASLGMAVGYVSKSLFEGESHSPARKLMGTALMFGVSNVVTNNPEFVKSIGIGFINLFKSSPQDEEIEGEEIYPEFEE